jgi:uncharacterized protein (DUF952 family)
MRLVYKILTSPQLEQLRGDGQTLGAPVDLADGYVHLSARDQVRGTLTKWFRGQEGLWLLAVDVDALPAGALRWEASRGGALFPHLYAPLPLPAVSSASALPLDADGVPEPGAEFPAGV